MVLRVARRVLGNATGSMNTTVLLWDVRQGPVRLPAR
jgi:hypothetical protein